MYPRQGQIHLQSCTPSWVALMRVVCPRGIRPFVTRVKPVVAHSFHFRGSERARTAPCSYL